MKKTILSVSNVTETGPEMLFSAEIRSFNLKSLDLFSVALKKNEMQSEASEYLFVQIAGMRPYCFEPGARLELRFDEVEG